MPELEGANVLTEDRPAEVEEVTAEETPIAEAEESGEEKPQADAKQGEEAEHKKRLGGWQRKIIKTETERDFWREEALRTRGDKSDKPNAEPDPDRPKPPRLKEFPGTVEEFDKAQEKYEADLEKWTDNKREEDRIKREVETSVASLTQQVSELPELDDMKAAVKKHKLPYRLTDLLVAETAKLKNGAETLRALLLDPEEAAQLAEYDKFEDGNSLKAQIISMSRALRIAGKKSEQEDTEDKPAPPKPPAPITPVKKVAPTQTGLSDDEPIEKWMAKRNASAPAELYGKRK